jgi:hypothetical protein
MHFPAACLEAWARLDVLVLPDSIPCFIQYLVSIGKERRPAHAILRSTRTVAFGGLRRCKRWASAYQVAHAADGLLEAPSPPALDPLWVPSAAAAGEALFPYDGALPPNSGPGPIGEMPGCFRCSPWRSVADWMIPGSRGLGALPGQISSMWSG